MLRTVAALQNQDAQAGRCRAAYIFPDPGECQFKGLITAAAQRRPTGLRRYGRFQFLIGVIWVSIICVGSSSAHAQIADTTLQKISFDQHPGAQINLETQFRDETGRTVRLGDYFGKKPVILVLGYYGCPMLCTFVLNGMIGSLQDIDWEIGNEFEVINVSINPHETATLATAKKKTYLKRYGRSGSAAQGWHFLTGDESSIQRLAGEVGFNYAYDAQIQQYAHPSGLVILTSTGKISHYLSGVVYSPEEMKNALVDASSNKVGSPIRQLFLLCFHYSPITGKYGAIIMTTVRVCGVVLFLGLAGGVVVMLRNENKPGPKPAAPHPR